jgi:hypothetical protein
MFEKTKQKTGFGIDDPASHDRLNIHKPPFQVKNDRLDWNKKPA